MVTEKGFAGFDLMFDLERGLTPKWPTESAACYEAVTTWMITKEQDYGMYEAEAVPAKMPRLEAAEAVSANISAPGSGQIDTKSACNGEKQGNRFFSGTTSMTNSNNQGHQSNSPRHN